MPSQPSADRQRHGSGTLLALHGHGDDPATTLGWASSIAPPGWHVEAVPAPPGSREEGSWFDTGARGADAGGLQRSADQVGDAVRAAAVRGPVVAAGFSQGAAVALSLGEMAGLVAVVGICGYLPESEALEPSSGPPALLVGATADEVTPAFLSEDAAELMTHGGRDATFVAVGGGHLVSDDAVSAARRWVHERVVGRLRLSFGLPTDRVRSGAEFLSGEGIATIAAGFERIGVDALFVTDHPAPDDRWLAAGGHHALEPTVALTAAAGATEHLRLHTHVYVLGYRNPFLAAKALASLDVLSGGRVILGVAAGYLRAEFEALGADFADRGVRLEESLDLLARIWSGRPVSASGERFEARSVTALPVPLQRPRPPVWVGGNSIAAMRRAITHGDGWSPFPTPGGLDRATRTAAITGTADLESRLEVFDELCEQAGLRHRPTVCFGPVSVGAYMAEPERGLAPVVEEAAELFDLGVDWLAMPVPGGTRSEVIDRAQQLHESITDATGESRARADRL